METAYYYLGLSGILTLLMWAPYIVARMFVWGIPTFLNNYPEGFPAKSPEPPVWAQRAHRAHLNMVETMPPFVAVVLAVAFLKGDASAAVLAQWTQIFFIARIVHYVVYTLGLPFLRTPVYLVSWAAILVMGLELL